ncbi:MAG: hypothetical protein A2275_07045 [Bacteroidetes bacterium RIFOXYA12_FULL_35_11]|nr:MAG: hypothetical protein A2X01_04615 [Bacteroidetes bacterium GWF2_35_48]OFY83142.1 MAG: hypothetical protein A2275_07045 [Bacteroidetes bacterium RIFOXYA12_FULL_35_11]HBX50959.1 hypothetical protein [Bacteroidales bacterium]
MHKYIKKYIVIFGFLTALIYPKYNHAQTFTVDHDIPYQTTNQYMWGPNGTIWSLDTALQLFNQSWNESWGFEEIANIFGTQWGVAFETNTWGQLASTFTIHGFSSGSVDVTYPVRIHLNYPADNSFNPGQEVTITSSYEVLPGWDLSTHFPPVGSITLDMDFGLGANMALIACLGSCDTFNIFPPINIPTDSITIFHISGEPQDTMVYPCWDSIIGFHFCTDTMLPIHIPDWWNIGLTGNITLPYVNTVDYLGADNCLYASGDSTYLHFQLNILQFLSSMAGFIPEPTGSTIQQYIGYLNDTVTLDVGFQINIIYSLFTAQLNMHNALHQDFTFCPDLFTNFVFPTSLDYYVSDPENNYDIVENGTNDSMTVKVGHDLTIQYPCTGFPTMNVATSHFMQNDFTNHTWDSISFNLIMTALTVHINIPTFKALPDAEIPPHCIALEDTLICMESFNHIAVYTGSNAGNNGYPDTIIYPQPMDMDWQIGPLFEWDIPLGYIPFTWFHETWELEGLDSIYPFPLTEITPNPPISVTPTLQNINCYGDSTGYFVATATNGTAPYYFNWSTGESHGPLLGSDSIFGIPSGTYNVTITDANGCTTSMSVMLNNLFPPISLSLTGHNLLCYGDNTGHIQTNATGGTSLYTYSWSPNLPDIPNPANLPIGTYHLTLTDGLNCSDTASVLISQPSYMNINLSGTHIVHCNGICNGEAIVAPNGGTQPYFYNWASGQTVSQLTNLCIGSYPVTVNDANGCDTNFVAIVTDPSDLELEMKPSHVSCHSFCNGYLDVVCHNGLTPFTYFWSDGQNTNPADSLCAGLYNVTVMSGDSCLRLANFVITEPDTMLSFLSQVSPVICFQDSVILHSFATGGTQPYEFNWNHTASLNNDVWVQAGTYSLTVTDGNRCVDYTQITVTEPELLVFNPNLNVTNCVQSCNGIAQVAPIGGISPYSYVWNNGSTNYYINHLCSGYYNVTLTDSLGCIKTETYFIDVYPYPPTLLTSVDDNSIFEGRSTTLHATEEVSYIYTWDPSYGLNDIHSPNPTANPKQTTFYTVSIVDSVGCVNYDTITIFVNDVLCNEPYIFVPSGFTPDGDGLNDILKVETDITDDIYFVIFDRWGNKVFETTDVKSGWDGTYKGKQLDQGVFVYYLKAVCINNTQFEKRGNVTLVR